METAKASSAEARARSGEIRALQVKLQRMVAAQAASDADHAVQACAWKKATASELAALNAQLVHTVQESSTHARALTEPVSERAEQAEMTETWYQLNSRLYDIRRLIDENDDLRHHFASDADYEAQLLRVIDEIAGLAAWDDDDSSVATNGAVLSKQELQLTGSLHAIGQLIDDNDALSHVFASAAAHAAHILRMMDDIAALAAGDAVDSSVATEDSVDDAREDGTADAEGDADDASVATDDSAVDASEDGTADAEEGEAAQEDECGAILGLLPSLDVSANRVRVIQALRTASYATLTRLATAFGVLTGDSADVYESSIADAILEIFGRCGRRGFRNPTLRIP